MRVSRSACLAALKAMEHAFRRLERMVPPPKPVLHHTNWVLRYEEKLIEQALIQKLARQISGLHAIDVLLLNGLVQEQAVIQRTLDEIGEDITFLSLAIIREEVTPLHDKFLAAFWEEEFDAPTASASSQLRPMPRRRSIRAYNARAAGLSDPSSSDVAGSTLSKAYSGFVHAASPQVMDMCGGDPPRFHLRGMLGTSRIVEHAADGWNYFYRGLLSVGFVGKAFGDAELVDELYGAISEFESASDTQHFESRFDSRI